MHGQGIEQVPADVKLLQVGQLGDGRRQRQQAVILQVHDSEGLQIEEFLRQRKQAMVRDID